MPDDGSAQTPEVVGVEMQLRLQLRGMQGSVRMAHLRIFLLLREKS